MSRSSPSPLRPPAWGASSTGGTLSATWSQGDANKSTRRVALSSGAITELVSLVVGGAVVDVIGASSRSRSVSCCSTLSLWASMACRSSSNDLVRNDRMVVRITSNGRAPCAASSLRTSSACSAADAFGTPGLGCRSAAGGRWDRRRMHSRSLWAALPTGMLSVTPPSKSKSGSGRAGRKSMSPTSSSGSTRERLERHREGSGRARGVRQLIGLCGCELVEQRVAVAEVDLAVDPLLGDRRSGIEHRVSWFDTTDVTERKTSSRSTTSAGSAWPAVMSSSRFARSSCRK